MKQYIKIKKSALVAMHKLNSEKTAYIKKLEKALASVKRQLENIKDKNESEK